MTDRTRFNPRAYWAGLTPEQKQRIGESAMLWFFSVVAQSPALSGQISDIARRRWEHAGSAALQGMNPPDPGKERVLEGPDLAALGIRACRVCGCIDESACEGGCYWVAEDLCSQCANADAEVAGRA